MNPSSYIADDIDAVSVAETFAEELLARASEFEDAGFVQQDLADRMAGMGLYRMCNPKDYGGLGRSPSDYCRFIEALARYDASTAWVLFIGNTSALSITALSESKAKSILADPMAITAGVFAPMGEAVACEHDGVAGYRLSGQWQWGSGSKNATWVTGGGFVVDEHGDKVMRPDGGPDQRSFLMHKNDIELLDTWHVSGLKGTGSTDFRVEDLFVPEDMTFDSRRLKRPPGAIFNFPTFCFLAMGIGAVALGIAQASITECIAIAAEKTPQGSRKSLAMKPATHNKIAVADAQLKSARLFFYQSISDAWQEAQTNRSPCVDLRRDIRLSTTHAVQTAAEIVDSLYTLAGGTSIYLSSPMQRHFRDVHVVTQHMMVNDSTYDLVGRLLLGLETNVDQL